MKDFKQLKIYQEAVQSRNWQLCETISNNPELYVLRELIERIKPFLIGLHERLTLSLISQKTNGFSSEHSPIELLASRSKPCPSTAIMEYGDQGDWQIMEQAEKIIEEIL